MATHIWVNFASDNGLVPDDMKPLFEPIWPISDGGMWHLFASIFFGKW